MACNTKTKVNQLSTATSREEWRAVPDFEGFYDASTLGRIRRLDGYHKGRVLKRTSAGLCVSLCKRGAIQQARVSEIVCATFHGRSPTGDHVVFFSDNNIRNTKPDNLSWVHKDDVADKQLEALTAELLRGVR